MSHEIVLTMTDYYDGPRGGIANYHGKPHVYSSLFDEVADDWSDTFLLQSVDEKTFRLAMEDWAIWCRWERAYHNGQTPHTTHPALPDERARHDELRVILTPKLKVDPKQAIRVRGRFEVRKVPEPGVSSSSELIVFWTSLENTEVASK